MNKEKLLTNIKDNLDAFQAHIQKIKTSGYMLHRIDIDLFRKKTLEVYEHLNELEMMLNKQSADQIITVNLPEKTPKGEIPEQVPTGRTEYKKPAVEEEMKTEPEIEEKTVEADLSNEKPAVSDYPEPENDFIPSAKIKSKVEIQEEHDTAAKTEKQAEPNQEKKPETVKTKMDQPTPPSPEPDESARTTIDLFSDKVEEIVADKFGSNDESSIADKMQKSQVNDLRQVIGINEKFLFINELFNGDMSRYNKVIDELNELSTQQGINAYLIELKVANQWPEENETFKKLKELLDRKIN